MRLTLDTCSQNGHISTPERCNEVKVKTIICSTTGCMDITAIMKYQPEEKDESTMPIKATSGLLY
jgi:predicted DNA-binding protein with PD1-like motif